MSNFGVYLAILLGIVIIWFLVLKRPVYEGLSISFLALVCLTKSWGRLGDYFEAGMSASLIYSMTSFIVMSIILSESGLLDSCIAIILTVFGRFRGGAGYASVLASAFMGAISGSGPGNVMATGAITIPAMKRSGFPAALAGNIESNASYLGNMIPPSSNIVAAMGVFAGVYSDKGISSGQFWIVLWGIAIWFILQRMAMVYLFCRYYKVEPMRIEELPNIKDVFSKGWAGLLLPLIILCPFILEYFLKSGFLTNRLGIEGVQYFSKSILLFVPGISVLYTCLATKEKTRVHPARLVRAISENIESIASTVGVCLIGYMVGELFHDLNIAEEMNAFILSVNFRKLGMVVFICTLTCVLGMVIPGSSLVVIFGAAFVTALESVNVSPLLSVAMLPCICGVMCGITPPLGLGMYAGMLLSGASFKKAFWNNLWWVGAQFILEVTVLMGWLPIIGL